MRIFGKLTLTATGRPDGTDIDVHCGFGTAIICTNIAKSIDFIGRVHSPWTVFSDFLAIAAITISNNSDPCYIATSKKVRDEREKRYLDIINQYDKREQRLIISMFNELIEELQSYCNCGESIHLTDVLGELFHELDFNDKWKGQFFTVSTFAI